jgi:membrane fusion protein (multidrug efflux system)
MSTSTFEDEVVATDKQPPKPAPAPVPTKKPLHPLVQRYRKPALIVAGIIAAIVVLYYAYDAFTHEETDDAYVTGHLHEIASRINGVVTKVLVDDNQKVKAGDTLVQLDTSEYDALLMAAKANLDDAQKNLDRQEPLLATHAMAPQDVDHTRDTRDEDLAQYELAELQIQYSSIKAPSDGYIGRKNVEVGNRISSGQVLMDVVEPDLWVVANFKETQLAKMHIHQPATITIDSIPNKVFTGKVDSFSPATGNEFALLPADNSTGNFTKIVQRVPVKVVFDRDSVRGYEDRIRAGESAIVKIALTKPEGTQPEAPQQ